MTFETLLNAIQMRMTCCEAEGHVSGTGHEVVRHFPVGLQCQLAEFERGHCINACIAGPFKRRWMPEVSQSIAKHACLHEYADAAGRVLLFQVPFEEQFLKHQRASPVIALIKSGVTTSKRPQVCGGLHVLIFLDFLSQDQSGLVPLTMD